MTSPLPRRLTTGRTPRPVVGVLALVALLLGTVAVAGPAAAAPDAADRLRAAVCGTVDLSDTDTLTTRAEEADAVFAGEVVGVSRTRVAKPTGQGTTRVWRHRVRVIEDYRGVLGDGSRVNVDVAAGSGDGSTSLTAGNTYLFFVTEDGSRLVADPCSGAVLLRGGLTDAVAEVLASTFEEAPATVEVTLERVAGAPEDPPAIGRMVAPGAALVLVGLLGLLLVSRLGRERH